MRHFAFMAVSAVLALGCVSVSDDQNEILSDQSQELTGGLGLAPEVIPLSPAHGGTYPRAVALQNGEFLAAWDSGAPGRLVLRTSVSNDGGKTFTDRGIIADHAVGNDRTLGNVFLAQLPNGRVLASFRHHDRVNGRYVYRLLVAASDDNGRTFSFLSELDVGATNGTWEPFLFNAPDGSLQAYYAREKPGGDQDIVMKRSRDGGRTWSGLTFVASQRGSRDGMPAVAKLNDGSLIAIFESFRTPNNPKFVVRTVQSNDSGNTWGRRRDFVITGNARKNAGAPYIQTLPDGRLVAAFLTDEDSAAQAWPGHSAIKLVVSEGVPRYNDVRWRWPAVTATPTPSIWGGLTLGPGGTPFVLYDHGGPKARRIVLQ